MTENTPYSPLAYACVALVVCLGAYWGVSAWLPAGSVVPTAVAASLAVVFYAVGMRGFDVAQKHRGEARRSLLLGGVVVGAACLAAAAFVVLGGVATAGAAEGDMLLEPSFLGGGIGAFVLYCLLTAGFEEVLFRGVLYQRFLLAEGGTAGDVATRALVAQAAVFAVLHITGFPAVSALGFGEQIAVLVMRVVAAFLFALLMARLVSQTGGIGAPIIVHALYDFILFAPLFASGGFMRTNPLAGGLPDLVSAAVQVVVLAVVVLACARRDSCYHTPSVS